MTRAQWTIKFSTNNKADSHQPTIHDGPVLVGQENGRQNSQQGNGQGQARNEQVKRNGKLRLSRDRVVSAITIAPMIRDQQDTVIERYGRFVVSTEQIRSMNKIDELQDKGSSETIRLVDNMPETRRKLAMLRNNSHGSQTQTWQPWHTENFRTLFELLTSKVGFTKQWIESTSQREDDTSINNKPNF